MSTPAAIYVQDGHPIRQAMEFVGYAEAKGFDAVWQADSRLVRDAVVPMSAFAAVTERITIGSGVVDCWTRNPARLASTFSTLDDLAPGRVVMGIGAWWDPLAAKVGIDRRHPLQVMREVVTVVRALLHNETVTYHGEYVHLDGVELDYVYQERQAKDVPIYIGATGMKMMELAGEIADGVVLNYLVSPEYNQQAIAALEVGLARSGRTIDDVARPQLVVCSVHEDRAVALDRARLMVTQYLGQQPHIMKASGVPQTLLDRVGEVLTWPASHEQVAAAARLVPDEIVQMLTACGTPEEARQRVSHYVRNGCTCPILYPLGDVNATIDAFAGWTAT
jgi:5,10-methylenetetrahydromethanopterin reductase